MYSIGILSETVDSFPDDIRHTETRFTRRNDKYDSWSLSLPLVPALFVIRIACRMKCDQSIWYSCQAQSIHRLY